MNTVIKRQCTVGQDRYTMDVVVDKGHPNGVNVVALTINREHLLEKDKDELRISFVRVPLNAIREDWRIRDNERSKAKKFAKQLRDMANALENEVWLDYIYRG